ncbi:hypothetical protein HY641_03315 [Candidatus Woesearchaeota archaeon]|nr:hypothetical protein [Candidatus Woesearchaeota archaeon]
MNTETIPAKVTGRLASEMDQVIEEGWYANRSELIRDAVRNLLRKIKVERLEAAVKEDVAWGLYGKD